MLKRFYQNNREGIEIMAFAFIICACILGYCAADNVDKILIGLMGR